MTQPHRIRAALCLLAVTLLSLAVVPATTQAAGPITFSAVSPSRVAMGADYASDVQGYLWDFSDVQHYAAELTRTSFGGGGALSGGMFVGTTAVGDPKIWLQDMTIPGAIPASNEGGYPYHAIDTGRYRYLTFRMYASASGFGLIYWHKDRSFAPGTFGGAGFKQIAAGWHTYTFDLLNDRNAGAGSLAWNAGPIQGLAIQPATASGIQIKLDYARLTPTPPSQNPTVTASWAPAGGTISMYYDTTTSGASETLIASGLSAGSGRYTWQLPALPPGSYYLIAKNSSGQRSVSPPVVVNAPPQLSLLAPSYTSGPDYATTVVGDPWDMSNAADVSARVNLSTSYFSNGIFSGQNPNGNGDPQVVLHLTTPIDPTRFYYLTYRMRLNTAQDLTAGSVLRLLWWTGGNIGATASTTKDVVIYEGWRTVTIDLRSALLEPGAASTWSQSPKVGLRLDPHEFPTPRSFDLDDVKLTGNDRSSGGQFVIRYTRSDANGDALTTRFYYDTNRSGANGTAITCVQPTAIAPLKRKVFLPAVGTAQASGAGARCVWDVRSVANGNYYIYAVTSDGTDSRTTYSDTPVEVRN